MADIEKFVYYDNGSKKVLKPTDRIVVGSGGLAFEGATSDDFETQITVTDPTADRTIEIPDGDGEIALLQGDSLPKALSFPVKNPSTTTALTKGQIVYISGHSGNKPEVSLARSDSASTMPAFGFVQSDIAAEAEGYVVYSGLFKGIDTNVAYSEGDTLYVSSTTAGGFENTPPTGSSNLIQNIGKIVKSDATNGEILVGGAGRTNATPNLNQGKIFIGNASNQSSSSVYTLPITDGTSGQVLTTNGSGAVTFQDAAGGAALDDITAGDAAVTLTTTTGNITIDAQGSDTDIIFKGTDGGVDTTFLTLDGSDAGTAIFNNDVKLKSDTSRLYFGADDDVYFLHTPDVGLTLNLTDNTITGKPRLILHNDSDGFSTNALLRFSSGTASPAANDSVAKIDVAVASQIYGLIEYQIANATANSEAGRVTLSVANAGSNANTSADEGLVIEGTTTGELTTTIPNHDGTSSGLKLGSTLVTATAAELNIMDGGTSATATTLVDADRVVVNDAGTMKQVAMTDVMTYVNANVSVGSTALDDIGTGDAESTLATTAGNIIIDAQGQDTDIVFKGNDGGTVITPLTLDMSAAGDALFTGNIRIKKDIANIFFGEDNDVYFTHNHNNGITLNMNAAAQDASDPIFKITSNLINTSSTGPSFNIHKAYLAQNDIVSRVYSSAGTSGYFSMIETKALGVTSSDEYGYLDFRVASGGTSALSSTSGLKIEGRTSNTTSRVKILDSYYLPTADGTNGQLLQTDGSGNVSFVDYTDSIMVELSIPGLDLQTDTNAFRFNAPRGITVTGLDLYLDQHTTSGDVTVTVTNTTDSLSMISLSITGTNTSATTTTVTNSSVDSGDIITFAITATPANAQGLRANLHYTRA